jgi:hypothetical protein
MAATSRGALRPGWRLAVCVMDRTSLRNGISPESYVRKAPPVNCPRTPSNEKALPDGLRRIEALRAGATRPDERDAAADAMPAIRLRPEMVEEGQRAVEHEFTLGKRWSSSSITCSGRRWSARPTRRPKPEGRPGLHRFARSSPSHVSVTGTMRS